MVRSSVPYPASEPPNGYYVARAAEEVFNVRDEPAGGRLWYGRSSFNMCHTTSSSRRAVAMIALCAGLCARRLAKWVRKYGLSLTATQAASTSAQRNHLLVCGISLPWKVWPPEE
jgi:hypothetical protein